MKYRLNQPWIGYVIGIALVCLICVLLDGVKGVFYGVGFGVLLFLSGLFTTLLTGNRTRREK